MGYHFSKNRSIEKKRKYTYTTEFNAFGKIKENI
jgi:hypothetical protein